MTNNKATAQIAALTIFAKEQGLDEAAAILETARMHFELAALRAENLKLKSTNVVELAEVRKEKTPKAAKVIEVRDIQGRSRKSHGTTYEGPVSKGQNADIIKGESIRLFGTETNHVNGPVTYERTFKVGDTAVHGSYNLVYTGTITAIGAKTVSIDDNGLTKRLDLYSFNFYNKMLDLDDVKRRNDDTMMCI
jgi:hypothetical protein